MFGRALDEAYDFAIIKNIHSELYARGKGHVKIAVLDGKESDLERILGKKTGDFAGENISEYLQLKDIPIIPGRVTGEEFGTRTKGDFEERKKKIQGITKRQVSIFDDVVKEGGAGLYFLKFDAIPYAVDKLREYDFKPSVVNRQRFLPQKVTDPGRLFDYSIQVDPKPNFLTSSVTDFNTSYPFSATYNVGRKDDLAKSLPENVARVQRQHHIGDVLLIGPKQTVDLVENSEFPVPTHVMYTD